ncbi:MAG: nucleotide exchange factor GrpE [Acidobacteriota bacterium]|nr:nucleotide exchange factor GrpE [Acidobacteriota bacterium]MDH3785352.1 nucleotide exchange factor GrpE [Acidobacteriota bacterium]
MSNDVEEEGAEEFKVKDRRHWADEDGLGDEDLAETAAPATPTIIDEYRDRTERAEQKLQDYIDAFKGFKDEQEQVRARLDRDVNRRVALKFGELVASLLESLDELDLALRHAEGIEAARPLAEGIAMTRRRFLQTLESHGVQPITPDGEPFDPNVAEALRVDAVDRSDAHDRVTETLRTGYRLGDLVIRPARVAVGRHG